MLYLCSDSNCCSDRHNISVFHWTCISCTRLLGMGLSLSPTNVLNGIIGYHCDLTSLLIEEIKTQDLSWHFVYRYSLAQEHGDLINLHDWFQSFRTIVLQHTNKRKQKAKQTPLPRKRKDTSGSEDQNEASIQYPLYFSLQNLACLLYFVFSCFSFPSPKLWRTI